MTVSVDVPTYKVAAQDLRQAQCLFQIDWSEPKQTVTITATVNVEVSYDIPLEEVEDFDARYFLQDNLSIDSWHGDVSIESFDVEDADVSY